MQTDHPTAMNSPELTLVLAYSFHGLPATKQSTIGIQHFTDPENSQRRNIIIDHLIVATTTLDASYVFITHKDLPFYSLHSSAVSFRTRSRISGPSQAQSLVLSWASPVSPLEPVSSWDGSAAATLARPALVVTTGRARTLSRLVARPSNSATRLPRSNTPNGWQEKDDWRKCWKRMLPITNSPRSLKGRVRRLLSRLDPGGFSWHCLLACVSRTITPHHSHSFHHSSSLLALSLTFGTLNT
jgi:hypothetical protein